MLLSRLQSGSFGVQLRRPDHIKVAEEGEMYAVLIDPARQLSWVLSLALWRARFPGSEHQQLKQAFEADARAYFDGEFAQSGAEGEARTNDASWTPIIELDFPVLGSHAKTTAARLIHRMSYRPGEETIQGRLIVPTPEGAFSAVATARAEMTGLRESILTAQRVQAGEALDAPHPGQAAIDDPSLDTQFPEHPLPRIRAALTELLNGTGFNLQPTATMPNGDRRVDLPALGCSVEVPGSCVHVSSDRMGVSPQMAMFCQVILGGQQQPRLLEVWRAPSMVPTDITHEQLESLARFTIMGWEGEGAADIEFRVIDRSHGDLGALLWVEVTMRSGQVPSRSVQVWFADQRYQCFRIGFGGRPHLQRDDLRAVVDRTLQSWQPLD